MGPGRYGVIITLVVGLLAGREFDHWSRRRDVNTTTVSTRSVFKPVMITLAVLTLTIADLFQVSRWVFYAEPVSTPPLAYREQSVLHEMELELGLNARLFAPGPNLPTLTGFASSPPYLGLGPAEYFDPALRPPYPDVREVPTEEIDAQVEWLRWAGVTHLLCQEKLSLQVWPVELVWEGMDEMVSRSWARTREPLYLYRLLDAPGRTRFADVQRQRAGEREPHPPSVVSDSGDVITIELHSLQPETLVLADLWFPGWEVEIDGEIGEPRQFEGMFRAVDVPAGQHVVTWHYRPSLVRWGFAVSAMATLGGIVSILATCLRRREGV
jgi:hypothetical protein